MMDSFKKSRMAWLAAGVLVGLVASGLVPHAPSHAFGTDSQAGFALATGPIDNDLEGVFFFDSLTGNLRCYVINPQTGKFGVQYHTNVLQPMGIDVSKNPKFLLTTGMLRVRRSPGSVKLGDSICYVAEITSGKIAAFGIPWASSTNSPNGGGNMVGLDIVQARDVAVRE